ncbi:LPXTG cell wall anchor domain-containing protein [Streptococcus porcorum]
MYFGISTMGLSGCVPASVANVITSLTGRTVIPTEVASYLYNNTNEFNKTGVGASSTGVYLALQNWGLTPTNLANVSEVETALKQGHTLLVAVEKDKFTPYGGTHELVLKGYSNGSTYAYDPYTRANIGWYPVRNLWAEQSTDPMDTKGLVSTFIKVTTNTMNQKETAIKTAQTSLNQARSEQTVAATNLSQAQASYDTALSSYNEAQTVVSKAKAELQNAENNLSSLMSSSVDLTPYEQALTEAQATLSQDEQAIQTAKETLALAKASATDKAIALSKAQANLTSAKEADALAQSALVSAQATLAQLKAELSQAQSATVDAKTAYTNAQATLETAKAQLEAMKTAKANLPSLVEQLTQAQAKLEELEALLATEEENLADLEAIADEALAIYEALLAQYQTQEVQAQRDAIITNGGQPVAIKDENGVIVAYFDGRVDEKQAIQTAYNKAVTKQVSAKVLKEKPQANYQAKSASLPNTGDDQTAIFSLMGLMVIGLAGGLRKRKG